MVTEVPRTENSRCGNGRGLEWVPKENVVNAVAATAAEHWLVAISASDQGSPGPALELVYQIVRSIRNSSGYQ